MSKKITEQEAKDLFDSMQDDYQGYTFVSFETDSSGRSCLRLKHLKCGRTFLIRVTDIRRKRGCPYCNSRKRLGIEDFQKKLDSLNPGYKVLSYKGMREKATLIHLECGCVFSEVAEDAINGHGCPKCFGTPKKTEASFKDEVEAIDKDYTVLGVYDGNKKKISFLHSKCGRSFMMRPNDFLNGQRCPYCSKRKHTSTEQSRFCDFIKSVYNGKVIENYCLSSSRNKRKELDIYLPDKKIGFEYDGLYWHSSAHCGKTYHLDKMEFYNSTGIRVINVFSDEWKFKRGIVEEKIKSILGLSSGKAIYARECTPAVIGREEKALFLSKHHIQGDDKAKYSFGLMNGGSLVAVMTFCRPRAALGNKNADDGLFELSRFATGDRRVVGGFSKLLAFALKNIPGIKKVITYADLRFTSKESNVYEACGFSLDHISEPNYCYIINNRRKHRYGFRKSVLKRKYPELYSEGKTEFEIMDSAGIPRIYDCGNMVFTKDVSQEG
jgi:glutaredoxin